MLMQTIQLGGGGGGESTSSLCGCFFPEPSTNRFDQVYPDPFWIDPFVEKEEKRFRRMCIKCFNCGEDHHINQCTEVSIHRRGL